MEYKDKKYTYLGGLVHGISTLATGMKTSIKVYFRKKVTEQYPENRKELKMFDRFRGTLNMPHNENNEHRCVACGLCQMACPNDTIKVISETIETEDGKKKKILAIFAICKGFGFQHIIQSQLFDYFPAQRNALEYMLGFVDQYLDQMKGGVFVGIGLCFLLWTLISLLSNIEKAFNDIWQVQGGRSFYRKVTDYTSMFLILPILMVASSGFSEPFAALGLSISSIYTYRFVLYRYLYFYTQYKG